MVADRAGTSGSCQALLMMMRVEVEAYLFEAGVLQRSRQTTPLHSASNAGSVPERWLARVLLVSPVRCVGVARQFIVIWFDHTQPSPLLPMASTGHPSMASLQSASSSGVVGCLNT